MRDGSSSSAGATYLDRARRLDSLRDAARRAAARVGAIRRVLLFGSVADGTAGPRSDADILVIVEHSPHEQARDRVPQMLRALSPLPCPIDLFVLTEAELHRIGPAGSPLVRVALTSGIDLL